VAAEEKKQSGVWWLSISPPDYRTDAMDGKLKG
jgi:hypothetical protein